MKEEKNQLFEEELSKRLKLKEEFHRKLRQEEIHRKQRSRCKWLSEGDKNIKFFHGMASARQRVNRIYSIMGGDNRLVNKEDITNHVLEFFASLYSK